jgi:hypothetical protein
MNAIDGSVNSSHRSTKFYSFQPCHGRRRGVPAVGVGGTATFAGAVLIEHARRCMVALSALREDLTRIVALDSTCASWPISLCVPRRDADQPPTQ